MKVLIVRNVNEALEQGIKLVNEFGEERESRNGTTLEIPCPVTTVYTHPWERVLISKVRDANPFFHMFESLWILAGRYDVKFLTEFNKRMGEYSDDGFEFNAPYGYRMRVGVSDWSNKRMDQVKEVIELLKKDPDTRQAVLQIWCSEDLNKDTKDKACNMSCVFRIRDGYLHLTVYNRSNDMVWGAYGANAVQFSMLQEYVAAHLNLPMGSYSQVTNSYHVYTTGVGGELWDKLKSNYEHTKIKVAGSEYDIYDNFSNSVYMVEEDMDNFEHDLKLLFNTYDEFGLREVGELNCWKSTYFKNLVIPMLSVYLIHKQYNTSSALNYCKHIQDSAWCLACCDWLENRI